MHFKSSNSFITARYSQLYQSIFLHSNFILTLTLKKTTSSLSRVLHRESAPSHNLSPLKASLISPILRPLSSFKSSLFTDASLFSIRPSTLNILQSLEAVAALQFWESLSNQGFPLVAPRYPLEPCSYRAQLSRALFDHKNPPKIIG